MLCYSWYIRFGVQKCLNRELIFSVHVSREWPYPEEEKKPNKRGFGQYKAVKGHKYEKEKAERCFSLSNLKYQHVHFRNMPANAALCKKHRTFGNCARLEPDSGLMYVLADVFGYSTALTCVHGAREADIAKNLKDMPKKIAAYRVRPAS